MGKARLQLCSSDSSSDDLSSDDETYILDYGRYQAACIADGLRSRQYRLSALRELQEVMTVAYPTASKKVQTAVYEDLLVAVQQLDSRQKVYEAATSLVAAAKRALPQQKRNQLAKEQREAAVATKRAARRQTGGSADTAADSDSDDESSAVVLGDVPLEVVQGILQALDPLSLAAAACVCRTWHELATADELWQQHLQLVFPAVAKEHQQQRSSRHTGPEQHSSRTTPTASPAAASAAVAAEGHEAHSIEQAAVGSRDSSSRDNHLHGRGAYCRFCTAAQRHPSMLLPWRSCRALLCGRLQWIPPGDSHAPRAAAAARAARRGMLSPGPIYVTHVQAVSWMMGKPWGDVLRNSTSNSSDGESDSDCGSGSSSYGGESHVGRAALRLWAIRATGQ